MIVSRLRAGLWMLPASVVVLAMSFLWRRFEFDDSLIYLRYVRNVLRGDGLVFNVGEPFNGLTSPLFTWLVLGVAEVTRDPRTATLLVSTVGMLAAALLAGRLAGRTPAEWAFVSTLVASSSYFYRTYGMETPVFLALLAGTLLLLRRRSDWVAVIAALMLITRFESALLALIVAVVFVVRERRLPRWPVLGMTGVILASPFVVNLLYYGHLLPGTAAAKFGQGRSGFWSPYFSFLDVTYLAGWVFERNGIALVLFAALAVCGVALRRDDVDARALGGFLALLAALYLATNMPNYHWYYAPFLYAFFMASGVGAWAVLGVPLGSREARTPLALVAAVALVLGLGYAIPKIVTPHPPPTNTRYETIAQWLRTQTPPTATVAAVEIGAIGWYSDRRVIDILGLVNERNAEFIANSDAYSWLLTNAPDHLICHQPTLPMEASCDLIDRSGLYRQVPEVSGDGVRLLTRESGVTQEDIADAVRRLRPQS